MFDFGTSDPLNITQVKTFWIQLETTMIGALVPMTSSSLAYQIVLMNNLSSFSMSYEGIHGDDYD